MKYLFLFFALCAMCIPVQHIHANDAVTAMLALARFAAMFIPEAAAQPADSKKPKDNSRYKQLKEADELLGQLKFRARM